MPSIPPSQVRMALANRWETKVLSVAEQFLLLCRIDFTNEFHQLMIEQRLNFVFHVFAIRIVDFRGDFNFHLGALGNLYGSVDALLRTNPAQEREIISPAVPRLVKIER